MDKNKIVINTNIDDMDTEERNYYMQLVKDHNGGSLDDVRSITIQADENDLVDISYELTSGESFERIRRITGYLTGTVDRWGDAKKAELNDRVKHA